MPSADHVAQAVTLLLAGGLAFVIGRALWPHGKLLAIVASIATLFAAIVPIAILVLIFAFQVFGIDLVD
jgi:hypothetical protein